MAFDPKENYIPTVEGTDSATAMYQKDPPSKNTPAKYALDPQGEIAGNALDVLRAIARLVSEEGQYLTIAHDWGYGTATLISNEGAHTHIGHDDEDEAIALVAFVSGLYMQLVEGRGLCWISPPNPPEVIVCNPPGTLRQTIADFDEDVKNQE